MFFHSIRTTEEILQQKLERQHLIISYIRIRLESIECFVTGYHDNNEISRNNIFIYEANLAILRSIMMALNELYADRKSIYDNSLTGILDLGTVVLKKQIQFKLESLFAKKQSDILLLRSYCKNRLCTKHFLKNQNMKNDFKTLPLARSLYTLALKIIRCASNTSFTNKLRKNIYKEDLLNLIKA